MVKQKDKDPIPYVIRGTSRAQNLEFYERYDEHFFFNKVLTFQYILDMGESTIKQLEEYLVAKGGANLSKRYTEAIRAEIFFTALQQCEPFFAMLIAPFQPLPHWLYLTTYKTGEIKEVVKQIVADRVDDITDAQISNMEDFIKIAVYSKVITADEQLAPHWNENIDNVAWLVKRIGEFYIKYGGAYNSYKHGLRVMTGAHQLSIGLQTPGGDAIGLMHIIQASEDSVTYLQKEQCREVDGQKEIPISEVIQTFSPVAAFFYVSKMSQMLETIKATRLAFLKGGEAVESINTFFRLDRDEVQELGKCDEYKNVPVRADEARAYNQFIAQMQASAGKQTDNSSSEDHSNSNT